MRAETLIIVNPVAGGGRAARARAEVARYFASQKYPVEFAESASTEDFRRIAQNAVKDGYRYVVALAAMERFIIWRKRPWARTRFSDFCPRETATT